MGKEMKNNHSLRLYLFTDTQWAYWEGIKNFYENKKVNPAACYSCTCA